MSLTPSLEMDGGGNLAPALCPSGKKKLGHMSLSFFHTNEVLARDETRRLPSVQSHDVGAVKTKSLNFRNTGDSGSSNWTAWEYHVTTLLCLPVLVLRKTNSMELVLKCPKDTRNFDGYFLFFLAFSALSVTFLSVVSLSRHEHRLNSMQAIDAHLFHLVAIQGIFYSSCYEGFTSANRSSKK